MKKASKKILYVLALITLIIVCIGGATTYLYYNLSTYINPTKIYTSTETYNQDLFEAIAERYGNQARKALSSTGEDLVKSRLRQKALGDNVINVIFVKPSSVSTSEIQPLLDILQNPNKSIFQSCNSEACFKHTSLYFAEDYMLKQAEEYGINDFSFKLNVFDKVYPLDDVYKVGDVHDIMQKDPFGITKLQDSFDSIIEDNKLNVKDDPIIFMYFDNYYNDEIQTNQLYDKKTFRSFAKEIQQKAYVNLFSFKTFYSSYYTEILIHESLHLYGATDKYIEDSPIGACTQEGRGEPTKSPALPQSSTDIMCARVEVGEDKFTQGSLLDSNLVINRYTAKEIGWVEEDN